MAHILPYVAAEHDDSQVNQLPKSKMQAAKKHYKWLERSLGNEVFSRLVDQHVGDIMLSLLKIVHDNDPIVQNEVIVLPNPPYFSPAVIQNTLEFLGRIFGEDCPLVAVLAKRRSELHKVFQGVVEYLANNCTLHTARLALSSAAALVHSLLPHLEDKLKDVSTCIIRYLVHLLTSYTSSLQKLAPYLADQCNELLYKVCCCALEHCPQQLASTIPTLFARLSIGLRSEEFPGHFTMLSPLPSKTSNFAERVCLEHPHHSLPVIIALTHAHADDDILKTSSKKQRCEVIEEDRVKAAKILVNSLKKTVIANHVAEFEKVSLAYLTLANWFDNSKHSAGDKVTIPSSQPLLTVRNLKYTAALTRPLRLQPSACYDPPLIVGWDTSCSFVGGINAPKRLTLKTSDGLKQFELLKGNDDIRQDAVMEQVFKIVNELLSKNGETRERGLSMRTYQVVPLSQRSGLIQWCNNTQAFGEYLIGGNKKGGAHKLYYPQDYTASTCREKMATVKSSSIQERYDTFQDILEHFHPVFRHFFMENYPSPHEWYKRRLAYTKSVATNSMVGYILGLGDRHVENILLDKSTAELIHIDLGIAFELGKILPTPETVPFRMTQDIIDGLGVMGVEGPLRQCCEATLGVLRSSGEVLVTLVEVLRHDPLHQWTLSPQQVAHLQATGDDEDQALNCVTSVSMADRVVLRVQQKLAGVEDGYSRTVAEQVNGLIQQATDHSNLSKLFPGWQPYL
nr:serine-protein kinase ATM-like [Cherax quadricarinatus]